jgi:trehalose utilization protein
MPIRTLVWGENVHEQKNKVAADNYPDGMHNQIAKLLASDSNVVTKTTTLQASEHGCSVQALADTDVLIWWGHAA